MATSSITKDFVVKDPVAYEKLQKELKKHPQRVCATESPELKKGKEKLSTFVFR